jgi:beta-glucanase (GH16 family)
MTTYLNYLGQPMPQSADPASTVAGDDPNGGDTWTAPAGPSSVQGGGGGDTLIGNTGDTTFIVTNPNDVVVDQADSGVDTVVAYVPYALPDNVQNLIVSNDFNYAVGNSLDNLIIVDGAQWVDGGAGNDVLVGGSGAVVFEEQVGQGNDVIYGWHAGDTIQLIDPALTNYAQVQAAMTQQGNDVVIQMASDETLTIRDVTTAQLTESSFFLPLDTSQLGALTFDDEFDTLNTYNASTNTGVWETNFGGNLKDAWAYTLVGNGEQEDYVMPGFRGQGQVPTDFNPFSIDNGILSITARPMTTSEQAAAYDGTYYSGMLNTLDTFQQQYGYFEIRAALPDSTGTWPAFWLEPSPYIPNAEIDITEHLGRTPDIDYVRAFGGDGSTQTLYNNVYMDDPTGFHTYGLLWTPTTVTFYLDGNEIMTGPTPDTWTTPMGMILNMAIGGPWAGNPDAADFPVMMQVDYVRAYALADGSTVVEHPTPTVPAATIRADGSEIDAGSAQAQLVTLNFDNGGAPITSNAIAFSTTAPDPNNLPPGDTFYVYNASGAVDVVNAQNGQLGTATTIIAGDVSQFNGGTWLTDGSVALTYYQVDNGVKDLWIAVLNQATGELYKQELGPADGDVHIVALQNDGFAVSWSSGGGTINGIAYDAHAYDGKGWLGQTITLPGDLQGINSAGDLIAAVAGNSSEVQPYQVLTPPTAVPASLSMSPPSIVEADPASGTTTYTYTVTRSYDVSGTSTVDWTVIGNAGSPAPASDFQGGTYPTGTLTFAPGDTTQTITITVLGGLDLTQDQTFAVTLKNVSGAVLAAATASGTIAPTGTDIGGGDTGGGTGSMGDGSTVETSAANYIVPDGITTVILTGSTAQTVTANNLGDTITSNDHGSTIAGGSGNDTLIAGHGSDTLIGGGGADTFVYNAVPWNAGQITDFTPGTDKIDLTNLLAANGYTGDTPVTDGWVIFASDGNGNTILEVDTHDAATPWPMTVVTIDGVAPAAMSASDIIDGTSPGGGSTGGGATVETSDTNYTVPDGVTNVVLTGTVAQTVTANNLGDTITSNDHGSTIIGGTGSDILIAGHGADTLTGGAGDDFFVFHAAPWSAGQITDFTLGADKLDLSAILGAAGYTGTDPVADGWVTFSSDGQGDTQVLFNAHDPSYPWPLLITTLDHVASADLTSANTLGTAPASDTNATANNSTGDGGSTTATGSSSVATSETTYTAPDGVTTVVLTGSSAQTVTANNAGDTITSNDAGSTIIGGAGNDIFIAGHSADMLTGNGGDDSFVFNYLPWNAGHITDFNTAQDVLDLKGIFNTIGYTGTNPVADGYLSFVSDGSGNTQVLVDPQGRDTTMPILVTTLDHIAPSAIHSGDYLFA